MGIINSKSGGGRKQEKKFVASAPLVLLQGWEGGISEVRAPKVAAWEKKPSRSSWESGKFSESHVIHFMENAVLS